MLPRWCRLCGTRHSHPAQCPGELPATGLEVPGARVHAVTRRGIEAYGVLLAPSGELWCARLVTYPNVIWTTPGGERAMKFVGPTRDDAERAAVDHLREHCRARGHVLRTDLALAHDVAPVRRAQIRVPGAAPAPRKIRFIPIRFGVARPSESGGTGNLSTTGLFVVTDQPAAAGTSLVLAVPLESERVEMRGLVRWMRRQHHAGGGPGMGVELLQPPDPYVRYVRALA